MFRWQDTVPSQYANSPTIMQLLSNFNTYIDPSTNIDNWYNLVWNVDTAVGWGLDFWGKIVGVSRVLELSTFDFFGFEGPVGASGEPFNQAIFYNGKPLSSSYALLDTPYRGLILAKAMSNICNGTIPAINAILIFLFSPTGVFPVAGGNSYCTDGQNMTMTYTFPSALDPLQSAVVLRSGVIPKPIGVASSVVT